MYLLVLATASMVAILGISGLMAARLVRGATVLGTDAVVAASLAEAGLAATANRIGRDETYATGPGVDGSVEVTLGEGSYRVWIEVDPDDPLLHRVRVRGAAGDAVRVLFALLREPPRLGPELLRNPEFTAGLHPFKGSGSGAFELSNEVEGPQNHVRVSDRSNSDDGIEQNLGSDLDEDGTYRLAIRVRVNAGSDGVRLGLQRRGLLQDTEEAQDTLVLGNWTELTTDQPLPGFTLNPDVSFFVQTTSSTKGFEVQRASVRQVLAYAVAEVVPGSRAWLADEADEADGPDGE